MNLKVKECINRLKDIRRFHQNNKDHIDTIDFALKILERLETVKIVGITADVVRDDVPLGFASTFAAGQQDMLDRIRGDK